MVFNSVIFFTVFILMALIYHISPKAIKLLIIALFNVYFYIYAMGDKFYLIILTSILVYITGILLEKSKKYKGEFLLAFLFVTGLILSLLYFKYYNFIRINLNSIIKLPEKSIIAPIGVSFYTLQAISYLIDIYKGKILSEKNPLIFFNYIAFFGTILSGPIERAESFLPQQHKLKTFSLEGTFQGMSLVLWGLFKKVVIADRIGRYVDLVYNNPYGYSWSPVLFVFFLYSIQLYADFSGYSSMAQGFSKILGIDIITNFNYPYFSKSVGEFWRRWHISLSSFFRDYLYIPLGGSRKGNIRTYVNSMIIFIVSGIWHGANWTFIFWGFLHGVYISVERFLNKTLDYSKKIPALFRVLISYGLVSFAWIFFRASSIRQGLHLIKASTWKEPNTLTSILSLMNIQQFILVILLIILLFSYEYFRFKDLDKKYKALTLWAYGFMILGIILLGEASQTQFIYFKF